jgi:putative membrane protein
MTASQSNLAGLSRFIFRAPTWYASLAFSLLLAAVVGVGAFDSGEADAVFRGILFVGRDAWEGVFFVGIPTVIAAFGTAWVDQFTGGRLTHNRASLLALVGEVIIVLVLSVAALVAYLTPLDQVFVFDAMMMALASVFAVRLLVVMAVSRSSILVATIPASIQTVAAAVLLFIYSGTIRFLADGGSAIQAYLQPYTPYLARQGLAPGVLDTLVPRHFFLLGVLCVVYALAVWVFLVVIDRPWRNSMGVSMLDFLRGFIGHLAEGTRELEDFFEQIGEEAIVPVTVLGFRRPDGTEKARFVLPMIHPGPMGQIGGGNLPQRVADSADGLAFPPHATAGHDFNLVTEREVDTLIEAADRAADRIEYTSAASQSVSVESGDAKMLGQRFGDDGLLVNTFAPEFADDVDYGVGLVAATEARTRGLDDVLLVDAHNSNNGLDGPDLGHVTPGSVRSFDMIQAAGQSGDALSTAPQGDLSLGTAWDETDWTPIDGIGPLGIRVALTTVADQETAYVLVDGNNMEPGLRDHLVDAVEATGVDVAEVMTTDTHVVNTVDADNQVGQVIDHDELTDVVTSLVAEARTDTEPVEAGMAVERTKVTVFGNDRTETLASHANAVVSMGGAFAVAVVLLAMLVSVLLFFVT